MRKFHSTEVGIDYLLYVSLPRDYEKSTETYPVVYVMDADYCFPIVQTISRILEDHDEVRPLIIVGVAYPGVAAEKYGPIFKSNRTRDYTPTRVATGGYGPEIQKQSGGADRFLDFLENELTPYLQKNFRTKPDRGLVGYSFSGLLACYSMMTRPKLFQKYLVVSPSLWYDNRLTFRLEKKFLEGNKELPARAFFSVGARETSADGEKNMVSDLRSFVGNLNAKPLTGFQSKVWVAEEENHHSIFPGAAMRSIRFLYAPTASKKGLSR